MKYIKLFEEKTITRTEELKQFCNDIIVVEKFRKNNDWKMAFDFDEFSDDLIPFILFLNEKYGIKSIFYLEPFNNSIIRWNSIEKEDFNNDLSSLNNKKIEKLIITIKK